MDEGVHQGAIESSWFFSLGCNAAFQNHRGALAPNGGGVAAIIDDNYGVGHPADIFPAHAAFAADLAQVGLELQSAKSKCYIREGLRDANWDALRGDIPNGIITSPQTAWFLMVSLFAMYLLVPQSLSLVIWTNALSRLRQASPEPQRC